MLLPRALVPAVAVLLAVPALANAGDSSKKADSSQKVIARGEKLKGLPSVTLSDLVASPEKYQDKSVRVAGTVRRACTKMGCWMELAERADKSATGIRVRMKDHGFFVPLDSAGSKATVEGTVSVKDLSKDEAEHMTSEGGTVPTDKAGKQREVQVEAVGVELVRS